MNLFHLVVDFLCFFDDGAAGGGLHFTPADPTRIVDTREGLGIPYKLGTAQTSRMMPPVDPAAWAISANVTGVDPTAPTFVQLWPSDMSQPAAGSTLSLVPGDVLPNAAIVSLGGGDGGFDVYNLRGTTDLVMDLNGTFAPQPGAATVTRRGPSVLVGTPRQAGP